MVPDSAAAGALKLEVVVSVVIKFERADSIIRS